MPSPSVSTPGGAIRTDAIPDAPSSVAWTTTVPAFTARTTPVLDTVAIAGLLIVYWVPLPDVTSLDVPSE